MRSFTQFSFFILVILGSVASAADWPQYLGLRGDAISSETINANWKANAPKVLWKCQVGKGCGSWSIVNGKALVVGNDKGNDVVSCRDADTGKLIWQHQYPEKLVANLYEGGPNTTPTVDGNRVYTLSKSGVLFCLNLGDGRPIWRRHLRDELGGKPGGWGFTASPVVDGDLVYVLPCSKDGAFYALEKKTGKIAWNTTNIQRSGYATPVLTEIGGKRAALVFYGRTVVAHDLTAKGKIGDSNWFVGQIGGLAVYDQQANGEDYFNGTGQWAGEGTLAANDFRANVGVIPKPAEVPFQITEVTYTPDPAMPTVEISWPSLPGESFILERTPNGIPSWEEIDDSYPAADAPATVTTFQDGDPSLGGTNLLGVPRMLYRVTRN
ncbi:MAG TPA: hypothetical protein DD438_07505 [Verrucomicrobiales bacterium]|nr:hypothetical protein [Verrucomicrobiales bacterium]